MPVDVWYIHLYVLLELLPDGRPNGIANVALGTDPALGILESNNDPSHCSRPDVYCFAEHDHLTIFDQKVRAMRSWIRGHHQQYKPLIVSENSFLYPNNPEGESCYLHDEFGECFTSERIINFLDETMSYFKTAKGQKIGYPTDDFRLVQQAAWFSSNNLNGVPNVSDLVDDDESDGTLTGLSTIGQALKGHAQVE